MTGPEIVGRAAPREAEERPVSERNEKRYRTIRLHVRNERGNAAENPHRLPGAVHPA